MFDMIKHQFERGKINHLLCGFIGDFIVSCKPTESIQPCECSFHHPSERFWRESVCSVGSGTDLDVDIEIALYILNKLTAISAVDKSFPDRRPRIGNLFTHRGCESGIMYPGTADVSAEDKAVAVNSNIAFYAFLLASNFMHTNRLSSTNTLIEGLLCHLMFNLV